MRCHFERSLSKAAKSGVGSSNPLPAAKGTDGAGNFHVAVRFFDEEGAEIAHLPIPEAVDESGPGASSEFKEGSD